MDNKIEQSKALASEARISILRWLASPDQHFSHQVTGAPSEIGVCVSLLTEKLGMSQPTVSRHLELLKQANFLTVQKIGQWSFFKRNEKGLSEYKRWLDDNI